MVASVTTAGRRNREPCTVKVSVQKYISKQFDGTLILNGLVSTRMWPMSNVMVALPNIGGALCSMPQSLADTQ